MALPIILAMYTLLPIGEGTTQLGQCTFSEKWRIRRLVSVLFPRYLMTYPSFIDNSDWIRNI